MILEKITNLSFILRKRLDWRNLYTLFWYPLRQQSLVIVLHPSFGSFSQVLAISFWNTPLRYEDDLCFPIGRAEQLVPMAA